MTDHTQPFQGILYTWEGIDNLGYFSEEWQAQSWVMREYARRKGVDRAVAVFDQREARKRVFVHDPCNVLVLSPKIPAGHETILTRQETRE